jgi:hypothetical protein
MGGSTAARGHGGAINKRKASIAVTFEDAGAPPARHVGRTVDARGRGALLHLCPDLAGRITQVSWIRADS